MTYHVWGLTLASSTPNFSQSPGLPRYPDACWNRIPTNIPTLAWKQWCRPFQGSTVARPSWIPTLLTGVGPRWLCRNMWSLQSFVLVPLELNSCIWNCSWLVFLPLEPAWHQPLGVHSVPFTSPKQLSDARASVPASGTRQLRPVVAAFFGNIHL